MFFPWHYLYAENIVNNILTILTNIIPMIIYFITGSLCLLILFTYFTHPPPYPLWQPSVCSLYLWVCFCFIMVLHLFCFLDSQCKKNHMIFVFVWLISLSIITSRSIHVIENGKVTLYLWLSNIPLYIYTTSSLSVNLLMDT